MKAVSGQLFIYFRQGVLRVPLHKNLFKPNMILTCKYDFSIFIFQQQKRIRNRRVLKRSGW
ncbi:hypothetical protein B9K06_04795 [Bacillus sp. OG2]|nr:hypothetical protein B9K06_04795 [Bacillus sp. OG2]